eukprot:m51a1_g5238 putative protein tyrosine kinase domain containing protein (762) ;mRNA; f:338653-341662
MPPGMLLLALLVCARAALPDGSGSPGADGPECLVGAPGPEPDIALGPRAAGRSAGGGASGMPLDYVENVCPEAYDRASGYDVMVVASPTRTACGYPPTISEAHVLQLFTPRSVPWRYTTLCFSMARFVRDRRNPAQAALTTTVTGKALMYTVDWSELTYRLRPGDAVASQPFHLPFGTLRGDGRNESTWHCLNLTDDFVAWEKGVWLGVSYSSCDYVGVLGNSITQPKAARPVLLGRKQEWNLLTDDVVMKNTKAVTIRAGGHAYVGDRVPPGWICDRAQYNDGVCDCMCGGWDSDCNADPHSLDCGNKSSTVCDQTGRCAAVHWSQANARCNPANYWAYDGCDCNCGGAVDPDCFNQYEETKNCENMPSSYCQISVENGSQSCQTRWTCDPAEYGNGGVCNCECGVEDPDCMTNDNSTCGGDLRCYEGKCLVPKKWTCSPTYYFDDVCQCNCGIYDPGCQTSAKVLNCPDTNYVCNYSSVCILPGCGNGYKEVNESCKCLSQNGYQSTTPPSLDCQPICGDGKVVLGEECDGGWGCTSCHCVNSTPYPSTALDRDSCQGCGNGIVDSGESCDSGEGCDKYCSCVSGYHASESEYRDCIKDEDGGISSKSKGIISAAACATFVALAVATAGVALYVRRIKRAPRKLNQPIEISSSTFIQETQAPVYSGVENSIQCTGLGTGARELCTTDLGLKSLSPCPDLQPAVEATRAVESVTGGFLSDAIAATAGNVVQSVVPVYSLDVPPSAEVGSRTDPVARSPSS